ncbi:MAG: hypothetical protein JWM72_1208 [Actinomycetia bacterium]|nr:hypothetical protein [Actinomycetes bacterium]
MDARFDGPKRGPMLSRWSAILTGAAVGAGGFLAVMSFWLIWVADGRSFFIRDLDWFVLGTALFAAVVAGYVAGYVEDWRGAGVGMWNGVASWALLVTLATPFVLPNFLRPLTQSRPAATPLLSTLDTQMMVVICAAFAGGLVLAAVAGATSAASRRSKRLFRITPEAERQFLEDISRNERVEVIATIE